MYDQKRRVYLTAKLFHIDQFLRVITAELYKRDPCKELPNNRERRIIRSREFLHFLKLIDQQTPAGLDLHLIVDNYATHKTPVVKRWIKRHPRFHLHYLAPGTGWNCVGWIPAYSLPGCYIR